MVAIEWPINTAPGLNAQDGAGRLINVFPEARMNNNGVVYRRVPGATVFTVIYPAPVTITGTMNVLFVGST
jgi:hypothetical protein